MNSGGRYRSGRVSRRPASKRYPEMGLRIAPCSLAALRGVALRKLSHWGSGWGMGMALGGTNLASTREWCDGAERGVDSGSTGADTDVKPDLLNSEWVITAPVREEGVDPSAEEMTSASLRVDLGLGRALPPKDKSRMIPDPPLGFCSPAMGGRESREVGEGTASCRTSQRCSSHDFWGPSRLMDSEEPNSGCR